MLLAWLICQTQQKTATMLKQQFCQINSVSLQIALIFPFFHPHLTKKYSWKSVSRRERSLNLQFYVWFMSAVCSPVPPIWNWIASPTLDLCDRKPPPASQIHFAIHKSAFCNSEKYFLHLKQMLFGQFHLIYVTRDGGGGPGPTWCKEKLFSISPQTAICPCPPQDGKIR